MIKTASIIFFSISIIYFGASVYAQNKTSGSIRYLAQEAYPTAPQVPLECTDWGSCNCNEPECGGTQWCADGSSRSCNPKPEAARSACNCPNPPPGVNPVGCDEGAVCDGTCGGCYTPPTPTSPPAQPTSPPPPPPTNTPTPLPTPANVVGSCPAPGTSGTVSWDAVTGATKYSVDIDDLSDGWNCGVNPGDVCDNNVLSTSKSFTGVAGRVYSSSVYPCDGDGCEADGGSTGNFRCIGPSCTAPTITSPSVGSCLVSAPTLRATLSSPADQISFEVENNAGFLNNIACDQGLSATVSFNTASCSLTTGTYYWRTRNSAVNSACTLSDYSTASNFQIDKTGPNTAASGLGHSYSAGSNPGGDVTFSWTAATDANCAACGTGKACSYWIQAYWTTADGTVVVPWLENTGAWAPSSVAAPSYPVSCLDHDGDTISIVVRNANDSLSNSGTDPVLTDSFKCPAPVCDAPTLDGSGVPLCGKTDPSFSATVNGTRADQMQFAVDNNNPFDASWTCNSGWISPVNPATYNTCSLSTGAYNWSAREQQQYGTCTQSPFATVQSFEIDKSLPSAPNQPTGVPPAGANPRGSITFSWTASTDAGCGACGAGYACSYNLKARWLDTDGVTQFTAPVDVTWSNGSGGSLAAPSYQITCTGHDAQYAQLFVEKANDGVTPTANTTAQTLNWDLAGKVRCPSTPPTVELNFYIDGSSNASKEGLYGRTGLRSDDSSLSTRQSGKNFYNSIDIEPEVKTNLINVDGTPNTTRTDNIALSGAILMDTNFSDNAATLDSAKTTIDTNGGFILMYANKSVTAAGNSFITGNYYVYFSNYFNIDATYKGQWKQITDLGVIATKGGKAAATVKISDTSIPPLTPRFQVTLYNPIGNFTLSTRGYVMDAYNTTHELKKVSTYTLTPAAGRTAR